MKKVIVVTFGRFNPPTIGHKKLFDSVIRHSVGKQHRVFVSQTQDSQKNPLFFDEKISLLKKLFPKIIFSEDNNIKTPFEMLEKISKEGYSEVYFVVGQDRLQTFKESVKKQQGKLFNFKKIEVISCGDRDPDNDDPLISMSASKVRKMAIEGKFTEFYKCLPGLSIPDAVNLLKTIRKRLMIKELIS